MNSIEIPLFLYKYREDNEYTERIFLDKQVWLSNAEGLNDPFECEFEDSAAAWADEIQRSHSNDDNIAWVLLKAVGSDRQIKEVVLNYDSPAELLKNIGIFSLTEDALNPTMWAHYGASGKGLALGFITQPGTKLFSWSSVLRVEYVDGPIGITNGEFWTNTRSQLKNGVATTCASLNFDDLTVRRVIGTKSTNWSYEKEWRYIEHESGLYDWPGPLVQIVFGWATPKTTINKYIQLAKRHIVGQCQYFIVKKDNNSKKLFLKPIDEQQRMLSQHSFKNAVEYLKLLDSGTSLCEE